MNTNAGLTGWVRAALKIPTSHSPRPHPCSRKRSCEGIRCVALWRSRLPRYDAAILHLHGRLQSALDVKQHPSTVRMLADRLEQKLPVDAIEEALDVEIKHPVVAPAALAAFLLTASQSGADVIAIAAASGDTETAMKQAGEFGLSAKAKIVPLQSVLTDMRAVGLKIAQGGLSMSARHFKSLASTSSATSVFVTKSAS